MTLSCNLINFCKPSTVKRISTGYLKIGLIAFLVLTFGGVLGAQSLDIPTDEFGISIGNSKEFTGLRINFRDRHVKRISGINVTLWRASENESARISGLSLGLMPEGGQLKGVQLGLVGVSAADRVDGISIGLLGAGGGNSINGIAIGGLGAGSGRSMKGIMIGGLGAGSGGDVTGIAFGGFGVGAGGNLKGIGVGLLGAGAGGNVTGIMLGGLGVGSGGDMTGFGMGLLGTGAAKRMKGIFLGGLGVGSGESLTGIAVGGLGAGAPSITGIVIGGIGVGGAEIRGATFSLGRVKLEEDGYFRGLTVSPFNQILGTQRGLSLGIYNYARELHGLQLGLINYVRDNPKYLRVLPILNF